MAARPTLDETPVTVIGHPWAPIGMGEQLRSHLAAGNAVGLPHRVFDIFRYAARSDPAHAALVEPLEVASVPGGIRIFHINGDEVERVIDAFEARGNDFAAGYNIVVPAWELPRYPGEWAAGLRRFDEVWALSTFIRDALAGAGIVAPLIGQAIEAPPGPLLSRRHFGIRESAFVLLTFFDLSSHASRKNPLAVVELFRRLRAEDPFRDVQLVLKAKNGERDAREWAAGVESDPQIRIIDTPLDTLGVRGLINACDCFVSLHRAEGFGRGPGEAMALGRLAMATGWSGNVDFMTAENALLVDHRMVPLAEGDYPHWQGQSWAEPDLDHALALLRPVLDDPARGAAIARRGRREALLSHSNRAVGLRILARLEEIVATAVKFAPPDMQQRPARRAGRSKG